MAAGVSRHLSLTVRSVKTNWIFSVRECTRLIKASPPSNSGASARCGGKATPSLMASGFPRVRVAMTGRPCAIASISTSEKVPYRTDEHKYRGRENPAHVQLKIEQKSAPVQSHICRNLIDPGVSRRADRFRWLRARAGGELRSSV
jgi:hypothetical protein